MPDSKILRLRPRNEKSSRLRYLRDRLHITGEHAPSVKLAVEIIVEVLGIIYSPRYLTWARREAIKLRERTPSPSPEELVLFGILDDRLLRRAEQIRARKEKKKGTKKPAPAPILSTPTPAPVVLSDGTPFDPFSI